MKVQHRKRGELSPEQVAELRSLKGKLTAREAGLRVNGGAESIRRSWRGETYREGYLDAGAAADAHYSEELDMQRHMAEVRQMMEEKRKADALEEWNKHPEDMKRMLRRMGLAPEGVE